MKTMHNSKTVLIGALALTCALSILSTVPYGAAAQPLTPSAEIQSVGGSQCGAAWGLGLGLALATLSPCGILCATLAWYDLLLIGAYCD